MAKIEQSCGERSVRRGFIIKSLRTLRPPHEKLPATFKNGLKKRYLRVYRRNLVKLRPRIDGI